MDSTQALERYLGQRSRVILEVLEGDPMAAAVQGLAEDESRSGTANAGGATTTSTGRSAIGYLVIAPAG
jgi:hypothetical protein